MALSGAVFILWSDDIGVMTQVDVADVLAISSGFAFAVTNVLVRKADQVPIHMKMLSAWVGVICLSLTGIVIVQPPSPVMSLDAFALAILLGSFGMLAMTWLTQYGVTHLPVHRSAILFEFEVVAGAVSAALLTREVVTLREWIGGIIVMLAAWIIARDTIKQEKTGNDSYQNET